MSCFALIPTDLGERFILLTSDGPEGLRWAACAWSAARHLAVPFAAFTIGPEGDLRELSRGWPQAYGVESDGAVIVRPDGRIAWRFKRAAANPIAEVINALSRILR